MTAIQNLLHEPVFYGWSPANGNSSSHDFRVILGGFKQLSIQDLLSRGLGYRITFTMPEQEIRTEDPTSWPQGDCEILDVTGESSQERIPFDLQNLFVGSPELLEEPIFEHLTNYRVLQVEHTLLHTKIVENETDEYLFPVYSPPGSSIDERHLAAAERHQPVLGDYHRMEPGAVKDCISSCRQHLSRAFAFFKANGSKLAGPEKKFIRTFVEAAVRDLKHLFAVMETAPKQLPVPTAVKN